MTKRILVLGGTGRTGSHVISKALAAGISVNVLARRPEAVTQKHDNLTVFTGTPEKADDLDAAMTGCDAVIATMNNARASDSPFAKIVNSPTLLTDIFGNVIAAMQKHGIRRIVQLGATGAGDSFEAAPWIFRQFIKRTNLGVAYRDHEGVEAALAASGLDWTVGRAVGLGKKTGDVTESYVVNGTSQPKPSMQIARESVAEWMVAALDRSDLHGKTPTISVV
ncbi:MAG: NAD(P)-dependent oxidoreductase [Pelagimonas sp.]|uniref:NAD(P)-dependent oxidoreductase n=1 Tax=Pelagimonas sp. TaxID=2073170 RepID=UPI003D6ACE47